MSETNEERARELWRWDEEELGELRFPPDMIGGVDPITFEEYKAEWLRGITAALDAAEARERERCAGEVKSLREMRDRAADIKARANLRADHYAYDLMLTVLGGDGP